MRFVNPTLRRMPPRQPENEIERLMYCRLILAMNGVISQNESARLRRRIERLYPDVFPPLPRGVRKSLKTSVTKGR